jgi:hypothetical protein
MPFCDVWPKTINIVLVGGSPFHSFHVIFFSYFNFYFLLYDYGMCSCAIMLNSLLIAIMRYKLTQVLYFLFLHFVLVINIIFIILR